MSEWMSIWANVYMHITRNTDRFPKLSQMINQKGANSKFSTYYYFSNQVIDHLLIKTPKL